MMMFLSILCAGIVVLAILVAMLGSAEFVEEKPAEMKMPTQPAKFFATDGLRNRAGDDIAVNVMLAQIERHVRLEQAAAESFLELPTPSTLHSGNTQPLVN